MIRMMALRILALGLVALEMTAQATMVARNLVLAGMNET
jgi:hypothetical protein